jgi:SAM-dependent methyltransferase
MGEIKQVPTNFYVKEYENVFRFISYFYQVDLARKLKPKNVLEIGIGNKTVSNYLKHHGIKVDSCDYDKNLHPNYVGDIRNIPLEDNSYDLIMACQVLEHIPWKDLSKALNELKRVSRKYVIISLPYYSFGIEFVIKIPKIGKRKNYLSFLIRIPLFFYNKKLTGGHYWEIGRKGTPLRKVRARIKNKFTIIKELRPLLNSYHHFFILKKK